MLSPPVRSRSLTTLPDGIDAMLPIFAMLKTESTPPTKELWPGRNAIPSPLNSREKRTEGWMAYIDKEQLSNERLKNKVMPLPSARPVYR